MLAIAPTSVEPMPVTESDHRIGVRLYWQGYSERCCANPTQLAGWYAACEEDDRGRDAYLAAMYRAELDGERVDWGDVYDIAGITYNAYGDVVVGTN